LIDVDCVARSLNSFADSVSVSFFSQ